MTTRTMRILFVSAYFPPEMGAPAVRVYEMARRWAKEGHDVRVLTGFPNHPTGVIPDRYRKHWSRGLMREVVDGIWVTRCWLFPSPNRKPWQRILNYSSFWLSSSIVGPWLDRPDIVLATSPHLLTGLTGWWLGKIFRVPFLLEIRDLWPESLVASGVTREKTFLTRCLRRLARFLYRRAARIVAVTEPIARRIQRDWGVSEDRLSLIEHGVDGERFRPMPETTWPREFSDLNGQRVVSYIGTLGAAQGLATLLEAAQQVAAHDPQILFLLVGEGTEKEALQSAAARRLFKNVRFVSQRPREEIPQILNRSALCVACLKPGELFEGVMPTKILEYLACGRPVVLSGSGHAGRIVEESGGGLVVQPGDPGALARAILTLSRDSELRRRCAENGRRYVLKRFNLDDEARCYLDQFSRMVKG